VDGNIVNKNQKNQNQIINKHHSKLKGVKMIFIYTLCYG